MGYRLIKEVRENKAARDQFMDLAVKVFGLSFHSWYEKGYWRDAYIPYTYFDGDRAVANVSANKIKTEVNGRQRLYIQIGTVMTDPDYRNQGLARSLLEEVLRDFKYRCDGIYLYANDSVLDFYPKFGFVKGYEYCYKKELHPAPKGFRKLDMSRDKDVGLLERFYALGNPYSDLPMLDNFGLIMFYCDSFMKDCVYYNEELGCIVIASFDQDMMDCGGIFCAGENNAIEMDGILAAAAQKSTKKVTLGFMPKNDKGFCTEENRTEDEQLFVYAQKENPFIGRKALFPSLSHA